MDEKILKALRRIDKEVTECIELFENILSIGTEGGIETLMLQPLRQSEDVDVSDISIDDAVKLVSEKLERCVRLIESLSHVRYRVRHYVTTERFTSLDRMWTRIVNMAYSAVRRMRTTTVTSQQQVQQVEAHESPEEIQRIVEQAKREMEHES